MPHIPQIPEKVTAFIDYPAKWILEREYIRTFFKLMQKKMKIPTPNVRNTG